MKTKICKTVLFIGLGSIAISVNAQKTERDTVLNRQVRVERDYNPTIKDASKINTMPAVYEPILSAKQLNFQLGAPSLTIDNRHLGTSATGDIKTDVYYDKKRGYLNFGAGTYGNLEGSLGYRILNSKQDKLNFFGDFDATNGKVSYAEKGYLKNKEKARDMMFNVGANYAHVFDPSTLKIDASYFSDSYNYYGNSFINSSNLPSFLPDFDKKQHFNAFHFGTGLKSNEGNNLIRYDADFGFNYFKQKYGPVIDNDGLKGWEAYLKADMNADLGSDRVVGLDMYGKMQSLDDVDFGEKNGADHSFTNIYVAPYIKFNGMSWNVKLGVKVGSVFDKKNSFIVAPNVYASAQIADWNTLYLNVTGGVNENTVLQTFGENKFVNPMNRVGYSKTLFDANLGFRLGAFEGMEFEVFGGYKFTQKDHLYTTNDFTNNAGIGNIYSWGNLSNPIYGNIGTAHFGALIKTTLIPYTTLTARATAYSYDVKYKNGYLASPEINYIEEKKAWGKPNFTGELNADVVDIIPNLTISANYLMSLGRKASLSGKSVKMDDINELNFRGEYRLTDWFSVNAKLNNVLNSKYEQIYGYTLQGFNILGGASLKF